MYHPLIPPHAAAEQALNRIRRQIAEQQRQRAIADHNLGVLREVERTLLAELEALAGADLNPVAAAR